MHGEGERSAKPSVKKKAKAKAMAKGKESPNKSMIRSNAFQLMYKMGYAKASYAEIASRSKIARTLVQKHFPKKENLIADLIMYAISVCKEKVALVDGDSELDDTFSLRVLQLYITLLVYDDNMRKLTREMLENRAASQMAIILHLDTSISDAKERARYREPFLQSIGGVHELLYDSIVTGRDVDCGELATKGMANMLVLTEDVPYEKTRRELATKLLDVNSVRAMAYEILRELKLPVALPAVVL